MEGRNLVILGAEGHARLVAETAEISGWKVTGLISPQPTSLADNRFEVMSNIEQVNPLTTFLALGIGSNFRRDQALKEVLRVHPGVAIVSIVHPTASVSPSAKLETGSVLLAHASVGPQSVVGRGCILNTGASLDHDSKMGDFASLGPGARTGGNVNIGDRTMIGLNSGILQGRSVGHDSVIGAGSLVTEDIESEVVAWGSPCRVIRSRQITDPYY